MERTWAIRLVLALTLLGGGCDTLYPHAGDDGGGDGGVDGDVHEPTACESAVEVIDLNLSGRVTSAGLSYAGRVSSTDPNNAEGSCVDSPYSAVAVLRYTPDITGALSIDTFGSTPMDTVLFVRRACTDAETEAACNDDLSLDYCRNSEATLEEVFAGEVLYIFVEPLDGFVDLEYVVNVTPIERLSDGDSCSNEDPSGRCPNDSTCTASVCTAASPPTLLSAVVYNMQPGDMVTIVMTGHDDNRDVSGVSGWLTDTTANDWPADGPLYRVDWSDSSSFVAYTSFFQPVWETYTIQSGQVAITDNSGLSSDYVNVASVAEFPVVLRGQACDPSGWSNVCTGRDLCVESTCRQSQGPTLTRASLTKDDLGDARISITGSDPDGDVIGVEYTYINSAESDIVIDGLTRDNYFPVSIANRSATSFEIGFEIDLQDVAGSVGLRIELIDSTGRESNSMNALEAFRPSVAVGQECHIPRVLNACTEGMACFDDGLGEGSVCTVIGEVSSQVCAAELPVLLPNSSVTISASEHDPSLFSSIAADMTEGPETVLRLVLDEASNVTFRTAATFDFVMPYIHVRSDCDSPATEVKINRCPRLESMMNDTEYYYQILGLGAGTYTVFADTEYFGGRYTLETTVSPIE